MAHSRLRNFQSCCRLCLCEKLNTLKSVFDETVDVLLPQKIMQFVAIDITTSDKITTMVCSKCIAKIDNWHKYKKQCMRNQSKLDERLSGCPSTNIAHMSFHIKDEVSEKSTGGTDSDIVEVKDEYMDSPEEPMEEEYNELPPPLSPHPPNANQDSDNSSGSSVDPELQQVSLNNQQSLRLESDKEKVQLAPKVEAKYSCKSCNKVYSGYGGIWAHNKKNHPENKYPIIYGLPKQCKICDKVYQTDAAYFRHKQIHEQNRIAVEGAKVAPIKVARTKSKGWGEEGSYHTCDRCYKVFSSRRNLRNHMKSHKSNPRSSTKSVDKKLEPAGKEVARVVVLENKVRSTFMCEVCAATFATKRALRQHIEKHDHQMKPPVVKEAQVDCKYCKIAFGSLVLLTEHMLAEHNESEKSKVSRGRDKPVQFNCTLCKKIFPTSSALSAHIGWHKRSSFTNDSNKSEKIQKQNKITDKLVRNMKIKPKPIDPPKFQCTTCLIVFPNDTALQVHILEEHRRVSDIMLIPRCNNCNKDFATQDEYETHKRLHDFLERQKQHDQKMQQQELQETQKTTPKKNPPKDGSVKRPTAAQVKSFPCQYCSAGFSRADTLKGHIRQYHKEYVDSEFKCTQCDRVFDKRNSLSIHLKVHEKQRFSVANVPAKTFSCSICSKGFDIAKDLRAHTVSAHPF